MKFFKLLERSDKTHASGHHGITMTRFDLLPEQASKQAKENSVFQDN